MEKIVSAVFAMTGQDATEKEVQVHSDKIFTSMDTVRKNMKYQNFGNFFYINN